ncbi:GTPase HflX [Fictibacillus sp. WQ 8-8]|uniref:GTPase HflX n=1 Tax=Fictibacillus sp. WQ 8-8 TaxID=2938788 RepID=UPI0008F44B99|nr:GTPase HflX [Fictibacillus sp. WQ 8-8]MCQ6265883.1 GTPase HflX [Fictibacillus sp. WQ 8-8]SFD89368.1 GTP-binding protein HflX [Bacillus sp. OV194]
MEEIKHSHLEKAILVGCQLPGQTDERFFYSMEELESLTKTAQGQAIVSVTQKRERYDSATFIGKGKIEEILALVEELEPDLIIFNDELTPAQNRNLSRFFDARIIDRTQLILDIFATRARSREGKLQVELAQLQYILPRLAGIGVSLSRLGAGIGTRGPGETKLEKDRRHIRSRITEIKRQLEDIVSHRGRYRERRKENQAIQAALVGYTNAGKSTIFNGLTSADSYEENLLFATLDPLTRKMRLPAGLQVLVTDTVGFIQDLPTSLIAAFRSTLEEVKEADVLIHVIDGSSEDRDQHESTVLSILKDLDAASIPMITVYNKKDQFKEGFIPTTASFSISAFQQEDLLLLKDVIETEVKKQLEYYHIFVPAAEGRKLSMLKNSTILLEQVFIEDTQSYECRGYALPSMKLQ